MQQKGVASEIFLWKHDRRRHSLHSICSRICSFPPALVRDFILKYSEEGDVVFDPFSGKGTTALEALLLNRQGWGNDISPEAYILTKAKTLAIKPRDFFEHLEDLKLQMENQDFEQETDWRINVFYNKKTLKQILQLKSLLKNKKDKLSIFTKAIILGILHGSSENSLSLKCSHSFSMAPNYVKTYSKKHKLLKPKKEVIQCIRNKAIECFKDGFLQKSGKAFNFDSRKIKISDSSVDLIITSPPYFAVQTYAYDNWLRLWFLGYNYKDVAKTLVNTHSEERYGDFMLKSMEQLYRVLKGGKKCFIVVGDVKKRGKGNIVINTAQFLTTYAEKAGFEIDGVLIDSIPRTRKVLSSSVLSNGITTERILCLSKPS